MNRCSTWARCVASRARSVVEVARAPTVWMSGRVTPRMSRRRGLGRLKRVPSSSADVQSLRKTDRYVPDESGSARLIVLEGGRVGQRFAVDPDVTIGRDPAVEIVLDDLDVSRRHAKLTRGDRSAYVLEDLGSRNGTRVNGVPVKKRALAFGDKIQLGPRVVLLFSRHDPVDEQILQRQRFEALGRLASGVAHDFKNMLSAVGVSAEYLSSLPAATTFEDGDVREALTDMVIAVKRASELTSGLLSFVRGEQRTKTQVNISALCEEVSQLAKRTFDRKIRIEKKVAPNLAVAGDRMELYQVLMNLAVNARDAMPEGGVLRLRAEMRWGSRAELGSDEVVVAVEDDGVGMDEATRSQIFEPFFTTKRGDAGFGMGLATVKELVAAHGGRVEVESTPNRGSTFRVCLPAYRAGVVGSTPVGITNPAFKAVSEKPAAEGCVLLVDDEDVVRRSARRLLKQHGFQVIEAENGTSAIERLRGAARRPDVVILDMEMPDLSGPATLERLREIEPGLRVLFVSGRSSMDMLSGGTEHVVGFLQKPFRAQSLVEHVRAALYSITLAELRG